MQKNVSQCKTLQPLPCHPDLSVQTRRRLITGALGFPTFKARDPRHRDATRHNNEGTAQFGDSLLKRSLTSWSQPLCGYDSEGQAGRPPLQWSPNKPVEEPKISHGSRTAFKLSVTNSINAMFFAMILAILAVLRLRFLEFSSCASASLRLSKPVKIRPQSKTRTYRHQITPIRSQIAIRDANPPSKKSVPIRVHPCPITLRYLAVNRAAYFAFFKMPCQFPLGHSGNRPGVHGAPAASRTCSKALSRWSRSRRASSCSVKASAAQA